MQTGERQKPARERGAGSVRLHPQRLFVGSTLLAVQGRLAALCLAHTQRPVVPSISARVCLPPASPLSQTSLHVSSAPEV